MTRSLLLPAAAVVAAVVLMALGTRAGPAAVRLPGVRARPPPQRPRGCSLHLAAVAACFGGFGAGRRGRRAAMEHGVHHGGARGGRSVPGRLPGHRLAADARDRLDLALPLLPCAVDSGGHRTGLAQPGNPDGGHCRFVRGRLLAVQPAGSVGRRRISRESVHRRPRRDQSAVTACLIAGRDRRIPRHRAAGRPG